jgi:hypothetical protein
MIRGSSVIRHLRPEHIVGFVPSSPVDVQVLGGRVWLTEEGRTEDQMLEAGAHVMLRGDGEVVIQALVPADVRIAPMQDNQRNTSPPCAWCADWVRRLAALRTRMHLGRCDIVTFAP